MNKAGEYQNEADLSNSSLTACLDFSPEPTVPPGGSAENYSRNQPVSLYNMQL